MPMMTDAKGVDTPDGAILTHSGMVLDVLNPRGDRINLTDISQGLSLVCRWGAQSNNFCSVAQHSVHVYEYVQHHAPNDRVSQAWALMHDAAEAYLGDMPTPLKRILPDYRALEDGLLRVIMRRFGLPQDEPDLVKEADNAVMHFEWPELMPHHPVVVPRPKVPPFEGRTWAPMESKDARYEFQRTAEALGLYDV